MSITEVLLTELRTLIAIVLHVIGETAAHAGHLDIVRESIDGRQNLIMD